MSGPSDTFPPDEGSTLPGVEPGNDTEPPLLVIPRGFAQHAVHAALSDVYRAVEILAATCDALARQLDGGCEP